MRYRKKPVEIEAVQYRGNNFIELLKFAGAAARFTGGYERHELILHTPEGDMHASVGDYIIKGVGGEFYPCKPDIFKKTYEKVDGDED